MERGEKIKVSGMGIMGLETYIATFIENINGDFCFIDLGQQCPLEGKIRKIHKNRILKQ